MKLFSTPISEELHAYCTALREFEDAININLIHSEILLGRADAVSTEREALTNLKYMGERFAAT